jgi:hypothetical protein
MAADWILFGGHVETLAADGRTAAAVAIRDGRFIAVGSLAELDPLVGPNTRQTDFTGGTLLPGFCDTHMHLEKVARELSMVHLDGARSLHDVLALVERAAHGKAPDEWIESFGDDRAWHEDQLAEKHLPGLTALDQVAPQNPVFLFRGPDVTVLNSAAIRELRMVLEDEPPSNWDAENGKLTSPNVKKIQRGLLKPGAERELMSLENGCRQLLRMGITSVVDPGLPAAFATSWELYREAKDSNHLPQRVYLMNRFDYDRAFAEDLKRFWADPVHPLEGDDQLKAWAVKLILDGEFDNAWLRKDEPAAGPPATRYSQEEMAEVIAICSSKGWPLCVHALGGGAIDFVIQQVKDALARGAQFYPGQISLAHVFFPAKENLFDCESLGIGLSVQPLLAYVYASEMLSAWGEFAHQANPFATMLKSGVRVAGGSDVLPCEPLRGAAMAVTRVSRNGRILGPDQTISPRDALALFTRHAARYAGSTDLGVIAPDHRADFVIWSGNPLDASPDTWLSLEAQLVSIAGKPVLEN